MDLVHRGRGKRRARSVDHGAVADQELGAVENHGTRPEILQAVSGGVGSDVRASHTTGQWLFVDGGYVNTHLGDGFIVVAAQNPARVHLFELDTGKKKDATEVVYPDVRNAESVEAMIEAVADNAPLLAKGEEAGFQNKVHLAMDAKGFGDLGFGAAGDDDKE